MCSNFNIIRHSNSNTIIAIIYTFENLNIKILKYRLIAEIIQIIK